jgi:hypothetical protein
VEREFKLMKEERAKDVRNQRCLSIITEKGIFNEIQYIALRDQKNETEGLGKRVSRKILE